LSPSDVWVVGDQEGQNGKFETLAEHWNGSSWTVIPTPDPGSAGNHLYAVDAVSPDNIWAAGMQLGADSPDQGLVEHWNGRKWSAVALPAPASADLVMLDGITATASQVCVAGEADGPEGGGQPFVEGYQDGTWTIPQLPAVPDGANWTNLWGIQLAGGSVWAAGTYVDPATDNNNTLVLQGTDGSWTVNPAPNPGSGSNIPGGITSVDGQLWAAGVYDNGGRGVPRVMHREQAPAAGTVTVAADGRAPLAPPLRRGRAPGGRAPGRRGRPGPPERAGPWPGRAWRRARSEPAAAAPG